MRKETDILKDKIFWLLLIFFCIYILGNIGTGSLTTWDEAVYANISKNILKTGNWIVLHQGASPWFDKPPVYMWCTALFYNVFGISEFSTRLTSGIFGIATLVLTYLFVKKIGGKNTAILACLLLAATPSYLHFAKMGMLDVTLTFFITLMIYFFWTGREKPVYLMWSGLVLSLAYLTKGFAAFLGPIIIFFYCVFSGQLRLIIKPQFITGMIVSFLIIIGWHLIQYVLAGPAALNNYFGFHVFKRTVTTLEGHAGGPNFYQKVIFNKNKPWSVAAYASLAYLSWLVIKDKDRRAVLILSWITCTFMLYTVVKTKLNWYIVPIYPALAVSSAIFIERLFRGRIVIGVIFLILTGMLVQVPVSWAFKLDFNPDVKAAGIYAKKLWENGADIYMTGEDDSGLFYIDFARELNKNTYRSLAAEKNKDIYCAASPSIIKEKAGEYGLHYQPVYESRRISLYKLRAGNI